MARRHTTINIYDPTRQPKMYEAIIGKIENRQHNNNSCVSLLPGSAKIGQIHTKTMKLNQNCEESSLDHHLEVLYTPS